MANAKPVVGWTDSLSTYQQNLAPTAYAVGKMRAGRIPRDEKELAITDANKLFRPGLFFLEAGAAHTIGASSDTSLTTEPTLIYNLLQDPDDTANGGHQLDPSNPNYKAVPVVIRQIQYACGPNNENVTTRTGVRDPKIDGIVNYPILERIQQITSRLGTVAVAEAFAFIKDIGMWISYSVTTPGNVQWKPAVVWSDWRAIAGGLPITRVVETGTTIQAKVNTHYITAHSNTFNLPDANDYQVGDQIIIDQWQNQGKVNAFNGSLIEFTIDTCPAKDAQNNVLGATTYTFVVQNRADYQPDAGANQKIWVLERLSDFESWMKRFEDQYGDKIDDQDETIADIIGAIDAMKSEFAELISKTANECSIKFTTERIIHGDDAHIHSTGYRKYDPYNYVDPSTLSNTSYIIDYFMAKLVPVYRINAYNSEMRYIYLPVKDKAMVGKKIKLVLEPEACVTVYDDNGSDPKVSYEFTHTDPTTGHTSYKVIEFTLEQYIVSTEGSTVTYGYAWVWTSQLTNSEVNTAADVSRSISEAMAAHNADRNAHEDIRNTLNTHANDGEVHITEAERIKWNSAADHSSGEIDSSAVSAIVTEGITIHNATVFAHATEFAKKLDSTTFVESMATVNGAIDNKVTKATGSSLIADAEILRLATVSNYNDTDIRNSMNHFSNYDDTDVKSSIASNTSSINNLNNAGLITSTSLSNIIATSMGSAIEEIKSAVNYYTSDIIDDSSFFIATIPIVSGGQVYRFVNPIEILSIGAVENCSAEAMIDIHTISGINRIDYPDYIDVVDTTLVNNRTNCVVTIKHNFAEAKTYKRGAANEPHIDPKEDVCGVWFYDDVDGDIVYSAMRVSGDPEVELPNLYTISCLSGGVLTDAELNGCTHLVIGNKGIAYKCACNTGITAIENGGVLVSAVRDDVGEGADIIVGSGGLAYAIPGTRVIVESGGILSKVTRVSSSATPGIIISTHAKAIDVGNDDGEFLNITVDSAGVLSSATIKNNDQINIANWASCYSLTLSNYTNGIFALKANALFTDLTVIGGSRVEVTANARFAGSNNHWSAGALGHRTGGNNWNANWDTCYADGAIYNLSTTQAVNFDKNTILSGGNACGYFYLSNAIAIDMSCTYDGTDASGKGLLLHSNGSAINYQATGPSACLYFFTSNTKNAYKATLGGSNTDVSSGNIYIRKGAHSTIAKINGAYISAGTFYGASAEGGSNNINALYICSGMTLNHPIIKSGGTIYMRAGGSAVNMEILVGGVGGVLDTPNDSIDRSSIGYISSAVCEGTIFCRGTNCVASKIDINHGTCYIQNGAHVYNVTTNDGNVTIIGNKVNRDIVDMGEPPTVSGLSIYGNGKTIISNAFIEGLEVNEHTSVTTGSGAVLKDIKVFANGILEIANDDGKDPSSGAMIIGSNTNITVGTLQYSGYALSCYVEDGVVYDLGKHDSGYRIQFGSDIVVSEPIIPAGCRIYAHDNCLIDGGAIKLYGNLGLLDSSVGSRIIVGESTGSNISAYYNVFSGAQALETTVLKTGRLQIREGASASDVVVSSGYVRVFSGGTLTNLTNFGGDIVIDDGGIVN